MEIVGTLIKKLDLETGTSKAGKEWQKQSCVVERPNEKYNKEICINAFGEEKINKLNKLSEGEDVTILCNIYSREFNGKYYTSIDGYWFTSGIQEEVTEEVEENMPF
jgi:hypothetical protein